MAFEKADQANHLKLKILAAVMTVGLFWVFLPAFREMNNKWMSDPQYSHGYLVPVFSLYLLYSRRNRIANGFPWQIDPRGLAFLAVGAIGYVGAAYINFDYLAVLSFLPIVTGLFVLFGGVSVLRWCWPSVVFLLFMIPLPFRVERMLGDPLQKIATTSSTWLLQTMGFPAFGEGNIIVMEKGKIAVVEACNGLSMLLTFAAITTGMAILVKRPLIDKIILLLSTIPVAVLVNVIRISSNGVAMDVWGPDVAHRLFHDQAGWFMMPMAIVILGFELWVLSHMFIEVPEVQSVFTKTGTKTLAVEKAAK